jgi:hypothetical protein
MSTPVLANRIDYAFKSIAQGLGTYVGCPNNGSFRDSYGH